MNSYGGGASALLFLRGRLFFHRADGRRAAHNAGAPSVLIAYGARDAELLRGCGLAGGFVPLANAPRPAAPLPLFDPAGPET